jgi:polyisoprenoid-binding protein YceI
MAIRGKRWLWIIAGGIVVLFAGAYAAFAVIGGSTSAPPPVSLSSPSVVGSSSPASAAPGSLDGTWTLQDTNSFVGYRVREKFANLPAPTDAVGRTSAVTGSLTVDGLRVTAVDVKADLRQLRSDKEMRDERIRTDGLQSDQFPMAEFTLTDPIVFPSRPAAGTQVTKQAKGTLTLHGVTRNVTITLQARWSGDQIEVASSLPIVFADYDISTPTTFLATVEDHGTMELHLFFVKQA